MIFENYIYIVFIDYTFKCIWIPSILSLIFSLLIFLEKQLIVLNDKITSTKILRRSITFVTYHYCTFFR